MSTLDELIGCYESITEDTVEKLVARYAPDAYFKDPFNEVTGQAAIARIFSHMFTQVASPRFKVVERLEGDHTAMLVWEFTFGKEPGRRLIRGATHLKFNEQGQACFHRDYWDAAEELYEKVPVLGGLLRGLKSRIKA